MISNLRRTVKNTAHNYSLVTVKTREATSNAPALPTDEELTFLATQTFDSLRFVEVMCVLWKRLCDSPKSWRHVYKSLIVLEHLLIHGNSTVVEQCYANEYILGRLANFQLYESGVDYGLVVREIVKRVLGLLNSAEQLRERREQANGEKAKSPAPSVQPATPGVKTKTGAQARRSNLLESAPTTADEEETQLQLVLALSCQPSGNQSARPSADYGIQSALAFAAQDHSLKMQTGGDLVDIGAPPPSPAIFDFLVDQPMAKTGVETAMSNLIDISVPTPVSQVGPQPTAPVDPFDWIGNYNAATVMKTPSAPTAAAQQGNSAPSNTADWNPFGSSQQTARVNPFSF